MKNLILIALFLCTLINSNAQIRGNGNLVTKTFDIGSIQSFTSNLYADITLDMGIESGITITAEENIIEYINLELNENALDVNQKKWIRPTERIKILIGAPQLRYVNMDTHDDLEVVNIYGNVLKVDAQLGEVILAGKIKNLEIVSEGGDVDASTLIAGEASVVIKEDGKVTVNVEQSVSCEISEDGRFENINNDAMPNGCESKKIATSAPSTRFMNLKVKNNSFGWKKFEVIGPKPNGRKFSYGFSMLPGTVRKERWSIGTEIYKTKKHGERGELLVTLTEKDEGETVKLFD